MAINLQHKNIYSYNSYFKKKRLHEVKYSLTLAQYFGAQNSKLISGAPAMRWKMLLTA